RGHVGETAAKLETAAKTTGSLLSAGVVGAAGALIYLRLHGCALLERRLQGWRIAHGWRGKIAGIRLGFVRGVQAIRTAGDLARSCWRNCGQAGNCREEYGLAAIRRSCGSGWSLDLPEAPRICFARAPLARLAYRTRLARQDRGNSSRVCARCAGHSNRRRSRVLRVLFRGQIGRAHV